VLGRSLQVHTVLSAVYTHYFYTLLVCQTCSFQGVLKVDWFCKLAEVTQPHSTTSGACSFLYSDVFDVMSVNMPEAHCDILRNISFICHHSSALYTLNKLLREAGLQKLSVIVPMKKLPAFCGISGFITMSARASHQALSLSS
jgi:hypothetical protein